MIHRGPFQPLPFCESLTIKVLTSPQTLYGELLDCNSCEKIFALKRCLSEWSMPGGFQGCLRTGVQSEYLSSPKYRHFQGPSATSKENYQGVSVKEWQLWSHRKLVPL